MRAALTALAIVALGVIAPAGAAVADPGSTTVQTYERSGVETIACTGATAWLVTEDNHEVIHTQPLSDGSLQFVDNDTQTFTVQHADGSGPVYTGRGEIHMSGIFPVDGRQSAPLSYVFRASGTAPDGSILTMDEVIHAQAQPDGSVDITVDHLTCSA